MTALSSRYSTAFITGASGGLGEAFAKMLLREGVKVWGTARDIQRLEPLTAAPGKAAFTAIALDLGRGETLEAVFNSANSAAGGFDLVINNAGFGVFAPFTERDGNDLAAQLESALLGSVRIAHAAMKIFQARNRGCLVNVSSVAVEYPLPFMPSYNITKAGLSALSESLIFETRGSGVTVLDFRPGDYRTSFNRAMHVNPTTLENAGDRRLARAWRRLEDNLAAAPSPDVAARDLRKALLKGYSGTFYSGGFFQTRLAPLWSRVAPSSLRRAFAARYFGA